MKSRTSSVVFLPPIDESSTNEEIMQVLRDAMNKYHLRPSQLGIKLGYSSHSKQVNHMLWKPEIYINKQSVRKTIKGLEKLKREFGHIHYVTLADGIDELPLSIRVTKPLPTCIGHQDVCTWVSERGYCDRTKECQQLWQQKQKRRKRK